VDEEAPALLAVCGRVGWEVADAIELHRRETEMAPSTVAPDETGHGDATELTPQRLVRRQQSRVDAGDRGRSLGFDNLELRIDRRGGFHQGGLKRGQARLVPAPSHVAGGKIGLDRLDLLHHLDDLILELPLPTAEGVEVVLECLELPRAGYAAAVERGIHLSHLRLDEGHLALDPPLSPRQLVTDGDDLGRCPLVIGDLPVDLLDLTTRRQVSQTVPKLVGGRVVFLHVEERLEGVGHQGVPPPGSGAGGGSVGGGLVVVGAGLGAALVVGVVPVCDFDWSVGENPPKGLPLAKMLP